MAGVGEALTARSNRLAADVIPPDAKIALLSPCGWGNLGDAAIVQSLIQGIRKRLPRARLVAFSLNPEDTAARHGIEAYTCLGYSLPLYTVRERQPASAGTSQSAVQSPARRGAAVLRQILRALPIRGTVRTWLLFPFRAAREPRHLARSRERLRGCTLLVVAGGGQLDSVWGGPLGHPYVLWRWGRLSRSVRARFVFASVGTGGLSRVGRALIVCALRLAEYRSYRDEVSRELLRAPALTGADPIVPDLAYGLTVATPTPPARESLVIGLSPMAYGHPNLWPRPDIVQYRRHVRSFGQLAARALSDGHSVVIFTTDNDSAAIKDTLAALGDLGGAARQRLTIAPTPTLAALFEVLSGVDLVVAARLHGVVLAHLAHRPVLAVAHERKVRTLMAEMGQERYCLEISQFDVVVGYERLLALAAEREDLIPQIVSRVALCRMRVLKQYDLLFGSEPTAG